MIISIKIDVDAVESGFKNDDELKERIVDFSRELIINGAEELEAALTLKEVEYYE